jgi:hypothetical protein
MRNKVLSLTRGVIAGFFVLMACGLSAYESSRGPTELIYWDKEKTQPGYSFVRTRVRGIAGSYLIDMAGQVVNYWPGFTDAYLLEDGSMIGAKGPSHFVQADWDGNVLWEYAETRPTYHPHHDFLRIYNSVLQDYTVLFIANVDLTHEEVIALGADPEAVDRYEGAQMDAIVEVDRNGNVVWEYHFADHVVQDVSPDALNYVGANNTVADYPGRIDINWGVVSRDYLHLNAIDYDPASGHLAISSNRTNEIYIVDHDSTFIAGNPEGSLRLAASDSGNFLYRFGNPANYDQGEHPHYAKQNWSLEEFSGHMQMGGNHDIQWIKDGLPGAGNLLLFNNGLSVPRGAGDSDPQAEILELNPYLDGNGVDQGSYVNPPEAGYRTTMPGADVSGGGRGTRQFSEQIVWMYHTTDGFSSHHGSAVQRMPNGNTMAQLARVGRLLEITPEGEVVWEYVNPLTNAGILKTVITTEHENVFGGWSPLRYLADFPGLAGKELSPKGLITDFHSADNPRNGVELELAEEEEDY